MATPATTADAHDRRVRARLRGHLQRLYPAGAVTPVLDRLWDAAERFRSTHARLEARSGHLFDETDVWLIAYGDQVREPGEPPLATLRQFLEARVGGAVRGLHLLPHYPYTSDDGFAVLDHTEVDPLLGDWRHVEKLGQNFRLMLDAVVNHTSASSQWFLSWLSDDGRHRDFYLAYDPEADLTGVSRPRTSPLLTPFEAVEGVRHVWTTFSPDQVDLNYANPDVLLDVTEILLGYVGRGASALRLDAIAFLWKDPVTSCMHLPRTHEVIKLWRTLLDAVAPGTLLITETNVPHAENVAYFGDGSDEAHLVYQFPLAPLVLSAFHLADTTTLQEWAADLRTPSDATAFFNFLGSHDGIGVRPAEGLLTPAEIAQLCGLATAHGGGVSYKADPDGRMSPYELNTVYFDALTEVDSPEPMPVQVDRFLSAQSILLALAGIPGIYVQALLGSRNWTAGVEKTGRLRTINRRKFERAALEAELADPLTLRSQVFTRLRDRIRTRVGEPAFHPTGPQHVLASPPGVLALERIAPDGSSRVVCLHSVTGRPQRHTLADPGGSYTDLVTGARYRAGRDGTVLVELPSYAVRWLRDDG